MSPESEASGWVDRELTRAAELGKPILPLLLAGSVFPQLRNSWYDDVTGGHMPRQDFVSRVRVLYQAYNPFDQPTLVGEIARFDQDADPAPAQSVYSGRPWAATFASDRSAGARRRRGLLRGIGATLTWLAFAAMLVTSVVLVSFAGLGRSYLRQLDRPDAARWLCAESGLRCDERTAYGYSLPDGLSQGLLALAAGVAVAVVVGLLAGLLLPRWIRLTAAIPAMLLVIWAAVDARQTYSTLPGYLGVGVATVGVALLAARGAVGWGRLASGTRQYGPLVGAFAAGGLGAVAGAAAMVCLAVAFDLLDGAFRHTNVIDHSGHVVGYAATAAAAGAVGGTLVATGAGLVVVAVRRRLSPRAQISPRPGTARRLAIVWGCVLVTAVAAVIGVGMLGLRHGGIAAGPPAAGRSL